LVFDFGTFEKKNVNRLISVAVMLVALSSVFWRLGRVREGKAPPLERLSFSISAASISIKTNLI
jgi:hypothetical protein